MAENTVRQTEEKKSIKRTGAFSLLNKVINTRGLFDEGVPVTVLPKILFVAALLIVYIGNTHYAERTIRKTEKLKVKVDDLRAHYTTLKSDLMYATKQSEVARRVEAFGLEESLQPPYKLEVSEDEY
jgi:hypothetical protein